MLRVMSACCQLPSMCKENKGLKLANQGRGMRPQSCHPHSARSTRDARTHSGKGAAGGAWTTATAGLSAAARVAASVAGEGAAVGDVMGAGGGL